MSETQRLALSSALFVIFCATLAYAAHETRPVPALALFARPAPTTLTCTCQEEP